MKYIFYTIFIFSLNGYSQNFISEVMSYNGLTGKAKTELFIKDSLFTVVSSLKGKIDSTSYKITNSSKQLYYFTDGTRTHSISYGEYKGKIKGFKHTHSLNVSYDMIAGPIQILYYAIKNED